MSKKHIGNLFGSARAEADGDLLDQAFVETEDFHALTATRDFNSCIGRRGTGKTALYLKSSLYFKKTPKLFLHSWRPAEHDILDFLAQLKERSEGYRATRAIARVTWKATILLQVLSDLLGHWKVGRFESREELAKYRHQYASVVEPEDVSRCATVLKEYAPKVKRVEEVPGAVAKGLDLKRLQRLVSTGLGEVGYSAVFLLDGLDEGWQPTPEATAIVGGLALAIADFRDSQVRIHSTIFVRDNIFRALASLDPDYSRHIEGQSLRLHWDEGSLLHLVANRLRIRFGMQEVESDIKVWNKFAKRGLSHREGFRACLRYTLYRPRDALVLLNKTYLIASREGRAEIVSSDLESASTQISKDRLDDLLKEYAAVFPGLGLIIRVFQGKEPMSTVREMIGTLEDALQLERYEIPEAADFAVLDSGRSLFEALYSVGFLGVEEAPGGGLRFCHDGSRSDRSALRLEQKSAIHPCYWKALEIGGAEVPQDVLLEVHDDYQTSFSPEAADIRTRMLGQLVADFPRMTMGQEGARNFEDWVFRAVKILFSGSLHNPQLQPSRDSVSQRDIVATYMAVGGFWRRVRDDFDARQVVFEVKNFAELRPDDYRQAQSYAGKQYGRFVIIVSRSEEEGLSENERSSIQECWTQKETLLFLIPGRVLSRCISKMRKASRMDYAENLLNKRLDTFQRSYLSIRHQTRKASRRRKRVSDERG